MNKILRSIIFTGLLLIGITTSCNLPLSDSQKETETPTLAVRATETLTPVNTPTEFVPIPTATLELAPFCGAEDVVPPIQCQSLTVKEGGTFCTNKKPYTLIFINKGATYQSLTEGFTCSDNGVKDGRQIVACTGKMASSFKVNVCDPACVAPTVQAQSSQCPPDYHYNNLLGCCQGFQQIQETQQSCVLLDLQTTSCLVDCGAYTKKSTCLKNSIACIWDDLTRVCTARK
jgi:hypothetical protein